MSLFFRSLKLLNLAVDKILLTIFCQCFKLYLTLLLELIIQKSATYITLYLTLYCQFLMFKSLTSIRKKSTLNTELEDTLFWKVWLLEKIPSSQTLKVLLLKKLHITEGCFLLKPHITIFFFLNYSTHLFRVKKHCNCMLMFVKSCSYFIFLKDQVIQSRPLFAWAYMVTGLQCQYQMSRCTFIVSSNNFFNKLT